jgi:hypothetical protein
MEPVPDTCGGCGGHRALTPTRNYLHEKDCPALCIGEPVLVQVGDRPALGLGSVQVEDDDDLMFILAVFLRAAAQNMLVKFDPRAGGDPVAIPGPVTQLAGALFIADDPSAGADLAVKLVMEIGEWLGAGHE